MDKAEELARAVLRYDAAIRACKNDPDSMASYCTAAGETLDTLYQSMIEKSYEIFVKDTEKF